LGKGQFRINGTGWELIIVFCVGRLSQAKNSSGGCFYYIILWGLIVAGNLSHTEVCLGWEVLLIFGNYVFTRMVTRWKDQLNSQSMTWQISANAIVWDDFEKYVVNKSVNSVVVRWHLKNVACRMVYGDICRLSWVHK